MLLQAAICQSQKPAAWLCRILHEYLILCTVSQWGRYAGHLCKVSSALAESEDAANGVGTADSKIAPGQAAR